MASISIVESIEVLPEGPTKLSITTSSEDMPASVFAIEVLPTSRDKVCTKYRFSHICSIQELNEWPDQEDPDMCYFRTNEIEMIFDLASDAVRVLNAIRDDINGLTRQWNIVNDPEITGTTITIAGTTTGETEDLRRVFYNRSTPV